MPTQKYPINLATIAGLYGCSESVAKRMSAANVDLQNPFEVQQFLQAHARERTRNGTENSAVFSAVKAVEKPTYYLDVFASLYGVRKERLEAIVEAGVDLRNRKAVRAALAAQGTPPDQSPAAASQKPSLLEAARSEKS